MAKAEQRQFKAEAVKEAARVLQRKYKSKRPRRLRRLFGRDRRGKGRKKA